MRMTLATFRFKDRKNNEYNIQYYPEGPSAYRVAVAVNGMVHQERRVEGRQVLSAWNAKEIAREIKRVLKDEGQA